MDFKERIITLLKDKELSPEQEAKLEKIFPELAESDGDKERKELVAFLKETIEYGGISPYIWTMDNAKKWIALIEKQGEQNTSDNWIVENIKTKIIDYFDNNLMLDGCFSIGGFRNDILSIVNEVKQGEQNPTDKVGPEFNVGDKIRRKTPSSFDKDMQVARIEKDYYVCNHIGKYSSEVVPFSEESSYELIEQESSEKTLFGEELYEHVRNAKACIDDALTCESLVDCTDYCSQAAYNLGMVETMLREHEQKHANKIEPKHNEGDWVSYLSNKKKRR